MRAPALLVLAFGLLAGCADAPITAADLQSNGELSAELQQDQNLRTSEVVTQRAARPRVTGLVAAEASGPVEDTTRFSAEVGAIHLHLRVEDIAEPRPVTFVWTRRGDLSSRETLGFLQPSETLALAATLPVPVDIDASPVEGAWTVQVYANASLLFEREFEILSQTRYEALASESASPARHTRGAGG